MQKAARHPPRDGVRQTSFLQLQAVNGGHAVVHGQEGHGTVGADKPPFIPVADDFADKLAVVLSLDINSIGQQKLEALVPESEIIEYVNDLKSISKGRAYFNREFYGYDVVPSNIDVPNND